MTAPTDVELQELAHRAGVTLADRDAMLVTAESCTGGWIAKACTDVAGSSHWFLGGIVAYSNRLKTRLLDIPDSMLAEHGAVSEPVVRAMAEGALRRTGAHVSVAVSGVAGPGGGSLDKPVGTVWLAWAWKDSDSSCRTETRMITFRGTREEIRRRTVQEALQRLLQE